MKVTYIHSDGAGGRVSKELKGLVPPSPSFDYWTLYHKEKTEEGLSLVEFIRKDKVEQLTIASEEEVKEKNGSNDEMPDMLREYRDLTH